jgi:hypothetical protein
VLCADWNAGDRGLIPEGIWMPPPGPGSGKLGTPCARMQSANLIPAALPLEPDEPPELPEDPHAASITVQPAAARATVALLAHIGPF